MAKNKVLESINPDAESVTQVFCNDEGDVLHTRALEIYDEGYKVHEKTCPHDESCRGHNAHVIDLLKEELLTEAHTDREVLGLVASVCYILGAETANMVNGNIRRGRSKPRDIGSLLDEMIDDMTKRIIREEIKRRKRKGDV